MSPHTPLPWKPDCRARWYCIRDAAGKPLLYIEHNTDARSKGEAFANHRFLLTAVNHHYRLVDTVKDLLDQAGNWDYDGCVRARQLLDELGYV